MPPEPAGSATLAAAGNNSRVTVTGQDVRKVSRQAYTAAHASVLARQLERYAGALAAEPFRVPALRQVAVVGDPRGGYRVQHVTDWCPAPNLTAIAGPALPGAVAEVLRRIALMSRLGDGGLLVVPLDASAQNFHHDGAGAWLVDLFPPLLRGADGALPVALLQYGAVPVRRRLAEYAKGTVEGAIVHTLFTAVARGDRPLRQITATVRGYRQWCHDVLPPELPGRSRDNIARALDRRLARHFERSVRSNAVCVAGRAARVPAGPGAWAR